MGAPVGSVVCGSREFIAEARRARKILGGGMRQGGVLAGAGILALNEMVDRLADDHANAKKLAEGLAQIPGLLLDPSRIHTNIVFFEVTNRDMTAERLLTRLNDQGVRVLALGPRRIRAVTYHHITAEGIDDALSAFSRVMA